MIPEKHVYNGVMMSDSSVLRQHFTRALYLPTTPYQYTLTLDVSTSFCNKEAISELINAFVNEDADLAVPSSTIGSFYADNWMMLYKWNSKMKTFFRDWLFMLLSAGIQTKQANVYFNNAIHKALVDNRLTLLKISPNYAFTSRCYAGDGSYHVGDCPVKVSPMVNAKVSIVHSKNTNMCLLINGKENQNIDRPRSLVSVFNEEQSIDHTVVYSQKELEKVLGSYAVPSLSWSSENRSKTAFFWGNCDADEYMNNNKEFCGRV